MMSRLRYCRDVVIAFNSALFMGEFSARSEKRAQTAFLNESYE